MCRMWAPLGIGSDVGMFRGTGPDVAMSCGTPPENICSVLFTVVPAVTLLSLNSLGIYLKALWVNIDHHKFTYSPY